MSFLIEHLPYVLLMVISAGVIISPWIQDAVTGGLEVTTLEATLLMNQKRAVVLDTRPIDEFKGAHIPGARNIPAAELKTRVSELHKFQARPIIVVGPHARPALNILKNAGFKELAQLKGGMRTWQEAGLPSEKAPS